MRLFLERIWYGNDPLQSVLRPFSWIYRLIVFFRRWFLQRFCQVHFPVPVLVVGNLTVGGVGKTPLVIALAQNLRQRGLKVGVVSRGYGAGIKMFPHEVRSWDTAEQVGDEPLLLAQKTQCPVVIAPQRVQAVRYLLEKHQVQVVLSDDGLQHYRMGRSMELLVIDGQRGLGNGLCLPAGPLREPSARLNEVDFLVVNNGTWEKAYPMRLQVGELTQLNTGKTLDIKSLKAKVLAAVSGVGNPHRFYATLSDLGLSFNPYSYPDHHSFRARDLNVQEQCVVMTEKDAVKCREFASDKIYYLPVEAILNDAFWDAFWAHQQFYEAIAR